MDIWSSKGGWCNQRRRIFIFAGVVLGMLAFANDLSAQGAEDEPGREDLKKYFPVGPNESGLLVTFGPAYAGRSVIMKDAFGNVLDTAKLDLKDKYQALKYQLPPGQYEIELPAGKVSLFAKPGQVRAIGLGLAPNDVALAIEQGIVATGPPKEIFPEGKKLNFKIGNGGEGTDDPGPSTMR